MADNGLFPPYYISEPSKPWMQFPSPFGKLLPPLEAIDHDGQDI